MTRLMHTLLLVFFSVLSTLPAPAVADTVTTVILLRAIERANAQVDTGAENPPSEDSGGAGVDTDNSTDDTTSGGTPGDSTGNGSTGNDSSGGNGTTGGGSVGGTFGSFMTTGGVPGTCRIEPRTVSVCAESAGLSPATIVEEINRAQTSLVRSCCAAIADVQSRYGSTSCSVVAPATRERLGCN